MPIVHLLTADHALCCGNHPDFFRFPLFAPPRNMVVFVGCGIRFHRQKLNIDVLISIEDLRHVAHLAQNSMLIRVEHDRVAASVVALRVQLGPIQRELLEELLQVVGRLLAGDLGEHGESAFVLVVSQQEDLVGDQEEVDAEDAVLEKAGPWNIFPSMEVPFHWYRRLTC